MYQNINDAKASKRTADDNITMDTLKQIPKLMSDIMTTILNTMIITKTFPKSLKKARVLPIKNQTNAN